MDLAVLRRIAAELNDILPGMFVNKIHQPLPRDIVLRLRGRQGGSRMLMISADPKLGRLHLTGLRIPNPPAPPRFCAYLRAHFQGSRITAVSVLEDDRVVRIEATRGTGSDITETALILELLGRDSNILLVDRSTNLIMDCLHHIPCKESATRVVLPGNDYSRPPGRVRDSTRRAGSSIVLESASTANEAAEDFYRPVLEQALLESFRQSVATPLKKAIRSLERRAHKVQDDLNRLEDLAGLQHQGELLKGHLNHVRKGMERLDVQDWETNATVVVKLDPALGAVANMGRIFKKAAKGKRGIQRARARMDETREETKALEDLLYYVETARDIDELSTLAEDALTGGRRQDRGPSPRTNQVSSDRAGAYREFRAPSGRTVLVGRSGKGNDFLLRRRAGPGDLWFHVQNTPGAHVVLVQRDKSPVTVLDMEFAAGLAVHFSRAKGKGKVDVTVAPVKSLGHPKGAAPGKVIVKSFTTMRCEGIDPEGM